MMKTYHRKSYEKEGPKVPLRDLMNAFPSCLGALGGYIEGRETQEKAADLSRPGLLAQRLWLQKVYTCAS